jgi:hypothetical protein
MLIAFRGPVPMHRITVQPDVFQVNFGERHRSRFTASGLPPNIPLQQATSNAQIPCDLRDRLASADQFHGIAFELRREYSSYASGFFLSHGTPLHS